MNTFILKAALGGTICIGAAGDEGMAGPKNGVCGGKQKFTLSPHSWKDKVPTYISITAPAVVRMASLK